MFTAIIRAKKCRGIAVIHLNKCISASDIHANKCRIHEKEHPRRYHQMEREATTVSPLYSTAQDKLGKPIFYKNQAVCAIKTFHT